MSFYIAPIPWWFVVAFGMTGVAVGVFRGGRDGAVVGVLLLAQFGITRIFPFPIPRWLGVTEDLVTLAACFALVLTGRNYWTVVATASQLLSVITQVLHATIGLTPWAYYSALRAWFLLLIASVLVGSLVARRGKPAGAATSWRG